MVQNAKDKSTGHALIDEHSTNADAAQRSLSLRSGKDVLVKSPDIKCLEGFAG